MKRIFLFIIFGISLQWVAAQSVSKEIATKAAMQYMENSISNEAPTNYSILSGSKGIDTTYTRTLSITGLAPLYLIQLPDGWILVASEYIETPVLASARSGQFPNPDEMPDGMKWLISYYEEGMQYVRDSLPERPHIRRMWETVYANADYNNRDSYLPESYEIPNIRYIHWNQSKNNDASFELNCNKVYNKFCPTWYSKSCGHTLVGCTAVAIGIVMRYYQWPYSSQIPDTIYLNGNNSGAKHLVTYNWEKMPYKIYNSTEDESVNEIAFFLRDCGYASKMKYDQNGSGASLQNARLALLNNFHYEGVGYQSRWWFIGNWINKLKTEIAANRPVVYGGYNESGGHAFVLYGYTASNKFNINWGWGGAYNNGEFSFDSIQPYPTHPGYFRDHEVLWNITPKYPDCTPYIVSQSDVNPSNFEIYQGGDITLQNISISNNKSGIIYSGENIRLKNGMHIASGADVHIGIKNMYCEDNRNDISAQDEDNTSHNVPQKKEICFNKDSNIVKILRDGTIYIIRNEKIYTIQGQMVK